MSEAQEKEVPIKIHGIPVAMVKVRRDADGRVSITLPEPYSITNFDLIAQLTFDEEEDAAVESAIMYKEGYIPPRSDPGAKFRNPNNKIGLNGL